MRWCCTAGVSSRPSHYSRHFLPPVFSSGGWVPPVWPQGGLGGRLCSRWGNKLWSPSCCNRAPKANWEWHWKVKTLKKAMMFVPCRLQIEMNLYVWWPWRGWTAVGSNKGASGADTETTEACMSSIHNLTTVCSAYLDIHVERGKRKGEEGF